MKELSIEEKAKAYDEALERAKVYHKQLLDEDNPEWASEIEKIFPELKESEDEKIRESIIENLKGNMCRTDGDYDLLNKQIAWLEKQGEQKPVDKEEPKFEIKKGRWYVCDTPRYTDFIVGKAYYCPKNGMLKPNENAMARYVAKDCFHLWTIQDAKDGDVLLFEGNYNSIVLFQGIGINGKGRINYHCKCDLGNYSFGIQGNVACLGTIKKDAEHYHPATKEQRDTLERAMANAGYTFDFEKKELKKIEQHSAWSEEDMFKVQRICKYLDEAKKYYADITEVRECIDWLKSLSPQNRWKPSDEQLDALQYVYRNFNPPLSDKLGWNSLKTLELMYQDLKKL